MKKLLLFITVFTIVLYGCMPGGDARCITDFVVINQTESDIIVQIEGRIEQSAIGSNQKQMIEEWSSLCGVRTVIQDRYEKDEVMLDADMTTDGEHVPDAIWKRKYWDFTNKTYHATYTLIITDDLIESIL